MRGRVEDFDGSTDADKTVALPPPLAVLFSEVLWSSTDGGSDWIWLEIPALGRCLGLLDAVSDGLISFLSVPTDAVGVKS